MDEVQTLDQCRVAPVGPVAVSLRQRADQRGLQGGGPARVGSVLRTPSPDGRGGQHRVLFGGGGGGGGGGGQTHALHLTIFFFK